MVYGIYLANNLRSLIQAKPEARRTRLQIIFTLRNKPYAVKYIPPHDYIAESISLAHGVQAI